MYLWVLLVVCSLDYVLSQGFRPSMTAESGTPDGQERWGYVNVREQAHMFWWLYYTYEAAGYQNTPWIIWLQGGPGSSSCGYGNFELIGPLDVNLNDRNETWVKSASVLFIDNPVGTGYSYVDSSSAYTTDNQQIADDLVTMLTIFLEYYPDFQTLPLYIFGESYGGKMGVQFGLTLQRAIDAGQITVNLKGTASGNAWIGPVDTCLEWAPFLYYMGNLGEVGLNAMQEQGEKLKNSSESGDWFQATSDWSDLQTILWNYTNRVDFYNVLKYVPPDGARRFTVPRDLHINPLTYEINLAPQAEDPLDTLMNGPIRDKLGIIPEDVIWGGQSDEVFSFLWVDFMKPVEHILDDLLANTTQDVIIYEGVLDLICLTMGANRFIHKLQWENMSNYFNAPRDWKSDADYQTQFFFKVYDRLKYYWVINAGHMVPRDQPVNGRLMLERILYGMDVYPKPANV